MTIELSDRDLSRIELIGSLCQANWSFEGKRQCEKCVYAVRGLEGSMICLELVYDAVDGMHKHDEVLWIPTSSIQYLKALTPTDAKRLIEGLEKRAYDGHPRD